MAFLVVQSRSAPDDVRTFTMTDAATGTHPIQRMSAASCGYRFHLVWSFDHGKTRGIFREISEIGSKGVNFSIKSRLSSL